jgi:hypothetical protein
VLFITDDSADKIFFLRRGTDKRFGTADDKASFMLTRPFGSTDPNGVAFGANSLFVTDGDNTNSDHAVYRIQPGPNGRFDGVVTGDDVVTSIDTLPLGITKPSGVAYRRSNRHLYIVSAIEDVIVECTLGGRLITTYDMSATTLISASDIEFAPGSTNADVQHAYVSDRGKDNSQLANENDGRVFEFNLDSA